MIKKDSIQFIEVSETTQFICYGVEVNDELNYVDINFIHNPHNWGITVIDPDGKDHTSIASYNEDDEAVVYFDIGDICFSVGCGAPHNNRYELSITITEM